MGAGLGALFTFRPRLAVYLKNAQLRPTEWLTIGGAAFASYHVGHKAGAQFFGNSQALQNHWMAYHYVKTLNRFEGRQILTKKPRY